MTAFYPPTIATGRPVLNADVVDNSSHSRASTVSIIDVTATAAALRTSDSSIPPGLAKCMAKAIINFPLRIMIVDNSGSMQSGDGQRLVQVGSKCRMLGCSRWAELTDDVVQMAKMSDAMHARTDFHMLNPRPGVDAISIAADAYDRIPPLGPCAKHGAVREAMKHSPGGTTPLTEAVMRVVAMIEPRAAELRASGETVAVIIATDGLPDDGQSFHQAMQMLQRLPVWLVVRLCTDDEMIVNYWNSMDEQLEVPLEVLDDLRSEAEEVMAVNPWLNYGPPLHAARLFGLPGKLFDAIDEQVLTPSMIKEFVEDLLGCTDLPEPELDARAFVNAVRTQQAELPQTLNPKLMEPGPWVDLRKLERSVKGGKEGCVLM